MKRKELIRELEKAGCELHRHSGRHDIYVNPINGNKAPIPSHREIKDSRGERPFAPTWFKFINSDPHE